jgi:hypothetical protein
VRLEHVAKPREDIALDHEPDIEEAALVEPTSVHEYGPGCRPLVFKSPDDFVRVTVEFWRAKASPTADVDRDGTPYRTIEKLYVEHFPTFAFGSLACMVGERHILVDYSLRARWGDVDEHDPNSLACPASWEDILKHRLEAETPEGEVNQSTSPAISSQVQT